MLVTNPAIHIPAIIIGVLLIAFDKRQAAKLNNLEQATS